MLEEANKLISESHQQIETLETELPQEIIDLSLVEEMMIEEEIGIDGQEISNKDLKTRKTVNIIGLENKRQRVQ